MPIWLWILPPALAAPLAAAGGALSQLQTLPTVWHASDWRKLLLFVVPGLMGIPIGTLLLPVVDLRTFKLCVGYLLIGYCAFMLFVAGRMRLNIGGIAGNVLVGFGGGILGGLIAFPGPLPIMWASLQDWTKDQKRAFFSVL
jgi:uncharacterized membrane protein YfcA